MEQPKTRTRRQMLLSFHNQRCGTNRLWHFRSPTSIIIHQLAVANEPRQNKQNLIANSYMSSLVVAMADAVRGKSWCTTVATSVVAGLRSIWASKVSMDHEPSWWRTCTDSSK